MDGQTSGTTENMENQAPVDPWLAAFAALEQKGEEAAEATAAEQPGTDDASGNANASDGQDASMAERQDGIADEGAAGGLGASAGGDRDEDVDGSESIFKTGITDEDLQKFDQDFEESIHDKAMTDIAQEFLRRNVRSHNGILGATIDDEDICKRDEDGVPHYYNPETGQEFRGDNPRIKAREWVDDYNQTLAQAFNNACAQYEQHLRQEAEPSRAVIRFAPKYEKLDDIRRGMLDNVIEDYEIRDDNGTLMGYSCDLDKALAMVERQITMIQSYAKKMSAEQKPAPTGPALDMKTSSGAISSGEQAPPRSLAEAMEREQDKILERMRK